MNNINNGTFKSFTRSARSTKRNISGENFKQKSVKILNTNLLEKYQNNQQFINRKYRVP